MTNWSQDGAPSFNRPELVRFDSLRDSKDLGAITDIKAHLSGFIGAEAGSQSLFFSFQLLVPGAIQVQTVTGSKWTARFVSASLRSESGSIGLDDRGNARGVDIVNSIDADEALAPLPTSLAAAGLDGTPACAWLLPALAARSPASANSGRQARACSRAAAIALSSAASSLAGAR